MDHLDDEMATYLTVLRDAADKVRAAIDTSPSDPKAAPARDRGGDGADRRSATPRRGSCRRSAPSIPDRTDVVWLDHEDGRGRRAGRCCGWRRCRWRVCCATGLFEQSTVILTSATLTVGGTFDAMARSWGLADDGDEHAARGAGIDVGSPFAHAKSGILYVAAHLPPPGPRRHRIRPSSSTRSTA